MYCIAKDKGVVLVICSLIIAVTIIFTVAYPKIVYPILPKDDYGIETSIQDYNGRIVSFYLTKELQKTTLSEDAFLDERAVNVTDSSGCLVGDAIDIYNHNYYFQGIITSITGNEITFTPQLDVNYNASSSFVKCGEWNMNVDGSVTMQEFYINPPMNASWDIESIGMQFKDDKDWDINTFGSRSSLSNGFLVLVEDGQNKDLFLIYNNGGFALRGGVLQNFEKAPSGLYGFNVDLEFATKYGSILALYGYDDDRLVAQINDDLTSQTEIAMTIRGHYKDE